MSSRATTTAIINAASAPYWSTDLFAYYRARGKLRIDPAFRQILKEGFLVGSERILDLGCGQGLLAAWLLSARSRYDERPRTWPADWSEAPRPRSIRGIELLPREIERARRAWGHKAEFELGDIAEAQFGSADAIVILDVLHYLGYEAQVAVLERTYDSLAPGGLLLLRVADAQGGIRFTMGQCVDRTLMITHHRRSPRTYCRPVHEWMDVLGNVGFRCEAMPMSAGTPFANVLLIARPNKRACPSRPMTELLIAQ